MDTQRTREQETSGNGPINGAALSPEEKLAAVKALLKKRVSSEKAVYPLSYNQQALWFLYQNAPDNAAYHAAFTARIVSALDVARFRKCCQKLVDRHPTLRTTYLIQDGEPVQQVFFYRETILEEIDASEWSPDTVQDQVKQTYQTRFDLEAGPVFKVYLFKRPAGEHILLLNLHHIAGDALSVMILLTDLMSFYSAEATGEPLALPVLAHTYVDFAGDQAAHLATAGEALWAYWRDQLADPPPALDLPVDKPRSAKQTYAGASHYLAIKPAVTASLRQLARQEGTTLYTTLLSVFQVMLYRYCGQNDIVVGSPVTTGRDRAEYSGIVGDFVNTVAIRGKMAGDLPFLHFLRQMHQVVIGAIAHQEYPFLLLVEKLLKNRDAGRSPIFQVLFNVLNVRQFKWVQSLIMPHQSGDAVNWKGLTWQPFHLPQQEGQFDLTLEFYESEEELMGILKYNTDLFAEETIARMAGHLEQLLDSLVADPGQPIGRVAYLSSQERQQLVADFNQTYLPLEPHQTLVELFEAQVRRSPDQLAVVFGQTGLSYRQVEQEANQLAQALRQKGLQRQELVGVFMERSHWVVVALLGILKAGGAYLPLEPTYPPERVRYLLADAGVGLVLTQAGGQERLLSLAQPGERPWQVLCLESLLGRAGQGGEAEGGRAQAGSVPLAGAVEAAPVAVEPVAGAVEPTPVAVEPVAGGEVIRATDLAYVIYTSGSTGRPKGVMIQHNNVVNFLLSMKQHIGATSADKWISVNNYSFDIFGLELLLPLITGAQLVIVSQADVRTPHKLIAHLEQHNPTVMQATPSLWSMLIDSGWKGDKSRLKALCGGEHLPVELGKKLLGLVTSLWNVYGPTETTIWSSIKCVRQPDDDLHTIGRGIGNTELYVLDEQLELLPVGLKGEICIGGKGLARGYLNQPALTREKFVANPFRAGERLYRTGDQGRWTRQGEVEFLGRKDNQVKLRGYRIELGEIEAVLLAHPQVSRAAVVVEGTGSEACLVAYLQAGPEPPQAGPPADQVRAYLSERLPAYMVPSRLVVVAAWPLNTSGKTDRKALQALAHQQRLGQPEDHYQPPRGAVEQALVDIWQQVLGKARVGVGDNFFELGGHSLKAIKVITRLQQQLGLQLGLGEVFAHPTIRALAGRLAGAAPAGWQGIGTAAQQADYPLSHAQQRLWVLDQLQPAGLAYHLLGGYWLEGELDPAALEAALAGLVARHESLRTRFVQRAGTSRQLILPPGQVPFRLACCDLRQQTHPDAVINSIVHNEATTPFDLTQCPLLRATLIRVADHRYVFLFATHHIISDDWSQKVFLEETLTLYQASREGRPSPLPPLEIHYKDYAVWQNQQLAEGAMLAHRNYWLGQFSRPVVPLPLRTDYPRPQRLTYNGGCVQFQVDTLVSRQLEELSRNQETSLFTVLLTALKAFLYLQTNQSDIVLGTPIAGRDHGSLENQIGFYINNLALRTEVDESDTFLSLLTKVQTTVLGAYQHQEYPFDCLVEDLNLSRESSRSWLFDVGFTWHERLDLDVAQAYGLRLSPYPMQQREVKADLWFHGTPEDDGIVFTLEYSSCLFKKESVGLLGERFRNLLHQCSQSLDVQLKEMNLSLAAERELGKDVIDIHFDF